jgi:hypothetical protein
MTYAAKLTASTRARAASPLAFFWLPERLAIMPTSPDPSHPDYWIHRRFQNIEKALLLLIHIQLGEAEDDVRLLEEAERALGGDTEFLSGDEFEVP